MLSAPQRLRSSRDFTEVLRTGRRAGGPTLTLHLLLTDPSQPVPPRAGLVVSKAVGPSVTRHQVARRLRHLLRDRLAQLPTGASLVVRAAPAAGRASSAVLARDLDAALSRLLRAR